MLKGKTQIILTNTETGKERVYEDTNMMTNAISDVINVCSRLQVTKIFEQVGRSSMDFLNYMNWFCGGVCMFSEVLQENASKYMLHNTAIETAYADGTVTTIIGDKRGSFNALESEYYANGVKYVWDFANTQGNGTINAVCLTNVTGGTYGVANANSVYLRVKDDNDRRDYAFLYLKRPNNIENYTPYTPLFFHAVSDDQKYIYCVAVTCYINNSDSSMLSNCKIYISKISLIEDVSVFSNLVERNISGKNTNWGNWSQINDVYNSQYVGEYEISADLVTEMIEWTERKEGDDEYLCTVCPSGIVSDDNKLHCLLKKSKSSNFKKAVINLTTGEVTITETTISAQNVDYCANGRQIKKPTLSPSGTVLELITYDIITLEQDIKQWTVDVNSANKHGLCANGIITPTNPMYTIAYDFETLNTSNNTGEVYYEEGYENERNGLDIFMNGLLHAQLYSETYDNYNSAESNGIIYLKLYMTGNFVTTINNLSSPVIKTSADTMKVIYTVTEE